jgi:benzil reductase ((S)-benzoin forming)
MESGVIFITGGSNGIGFSLLKIALKRGYQVHNLSRTVPDIQHSSLIHHSVDLSYPEAAAELFSSILAAVLKNQKLNQIVLINNAGILEPMNKVGKSIQPHLIHAHFAINTISPIALTEVFVNQTIGVNAYKVVIHVGSGAADHAYEGWANYGASKAALHYFSRALALEQNKAKYPVYSCLFNPGRTDTAMQHQIREASADDFPLSENFKQAYEAGKLNNPDMLAVGLITKLENKELKQGDEVSHRDVLD